MSRCHLGIRGTGLLLAMLFCGWSEAAAQSAVLRGFVTDQSDGRALQGVNVAVRSESGELTGDDTNEDGFFTITRLEPGRYYLQVSFIGFQTVRDTLDLEAGEIRTYNVALVFGEAELGEVVVESQREGGAAQIVAGKQSIRPQDVQLIPTPDVSGDLVNYLTTVPGVVSTGDRGGQLFIRGGEPSHTLTLLDGMNVYQPFHVLGFYSAFPSEIMSAADIYAGGFGSKFSGRISSVLDVKTRIGNKRRFEPAVSLSPFISSALVEGPIGSRFVSFLGSARISMVEQLAAKYVRDPLPFSFGDFYGKIHATLHANHQVSFSALHTYDRGTLDQNAEGGEAEEIRWKNTAYGLRYLILPSSLPILGEVLMSVSRLDSEMGPPEEPSRSSEIRNFNLQVNITQYAGKSEVGWGFFLREPAVKSELGGVFQNLAVSSDRSPNPGAYFEPDIYVGGGIRIRPGIVGQLVGTKGFFLEPRFRIVWDFAPHQISGAFGLYRQDIVGLTDRRDVTDIFTAWADTPFGEASRAVHALAGYRITPNDWLDISIEGFYKRLSNLFIAEWTAYPRFTTNLQEANGRAIGGDIRVEVRRPNFYGFINYGLSSVEYRAMQESLRYWYGDPEYPFRPSHDRRHQVNILLSTKQFGFDLSARWNFGSGLPYTQVHGFDGFILMNGGIDVSEEPGNARVIYDRPFGGILPTFHRLDVSVERTFTLGPTELTVQGAVINVYDRANLFALDLFTLRRSDQLPIIPSLGIKVALR